MGEQIRQYLTVENIEDIVKGRKIYVFGAGYAGERMLRAIPEEIDVVGVIDNYRHGTEFIGKPVIALSEYVKNSGNCIVVASDWYTGEICDQLKRCGYKIGTDYYIWDNENKFHTCLEIQKFIEFEKQVWKDYTPSGSSVILAAVDCRHWLYFVIEGYWTRFLAGKYKSSIWGYVRDGGTKKDVSSVFENIYNACCGMTGIIDPLLSDDMKQEIEELYDKIWPTIHTWEDWKEINIYGIELGTTIIRYLTRQFNMDFEPNSRGNGKLLKRCLQYIIFWNSYFSNHDVKAVVVADGISWEGFIREIAIAHGVGVYCLQWFRKLKKNFVQFEQFQYFGSFWNSLTEQEKQYGLEWAKVHLSNRIKGCKEDIPEWKNDLIYTEEQEEKQYTKSTNKLKIMICPHIFEEDSYTYGNHLFDNNYMSWLLHLGELSKKLTDYDWYLKMHPDAERLDTVIINDYLKRFPNIKLLPKEASAKKLVKEGIKYALTVSGSIGHEYPMIGIQVINAGQNPGSAFEFNINPKTKQEYDNVIMHLSEGVKAMNSDDIYKFYCLRYFYYDFEYQPWKILFFDNQELIMDRFELAKIGKTFGIWIYEAYLKEWKESRHNHIVEQMPYLFRLMEEWQPSIFYRKDTSEEIHHSL